MNNFGFVRVTAASPVVSVGNPTQNVDNIISMIEQLRTSAPDIIVFPELSITGYSCGDLFRQKKLLDSAEEQVKRLRTYLFESVNTSLVFVGAPILRDGKLFNCAIAVRYGRVLGITPKQNIPNYNEFYESRHFRKGTGFEPEIIEYAGFEVPFGIDVMYRNGDVSVFAEVCEDLWMPIPPSSYAAIAGANILLNLSASNETVAKADYRTDLVKNQSGRCIAGYVYSSAGPSESTTDLVFGGHCLIAENGTLLSESLRIGDGKGFGSAPLGPWYTTTEIDVQKLNTERQITTSFGDSEQTRRYRLVHFELQNNNLRLTRKVNGRPFVPQDPTTLNKRCAEVFGIQCAGFTKRISGMKKQDVYLGLSGGLDSTQAILVLAKTYRRLGISPKKIHALSMPGFGTTSETKTNSQELAEALGVDWRVVDIREACLLEYKLLNHEPFGIDNNPAISVVEFCEALNKVPKEKRNDLVFENVQARKRTEILMNSGFVVGTGDMSELALGWCTYNGDHMSMYNVNCSVPKTLIKWLVQYVAANEADQFGVSDPSRLADVLMKISNTVISPELLPPDSRGQIEQSTESVLGPYELHDFFLVHFVRNGFSPQKVLYLAHFADFSYDFNKPTIEKTLNTFIKRFFNNQFKRSCVPDGPKVGSVSLSPRGDWRMPSDADPFIWLKGLEIGE